MQLDVSPFLTVDAAREWARSEIDTAAGTARARHITIASGQDAVYQAKYADAQAFVRAGYPDADIGTYPWVQSEASSTGQTSRAAADGINTAANLWYLHTGPAIETARIGGKSALAGILTQPEIVAHARAVLARLVQI